VARLIGHLLVPREFSAHLRSGVALVLELDRFTAALPWELMSLAPPGAAVEAEDAVPLAIAAPFARQLRTTYSPAPGSTDRRGPRLRALVIGDPGDPDEGDDLPGARAEAVAVVRILEQHGVDVQARIGAPSAARRGRLRGVQPADRLEVLELLLGGGFDLVHYCGHGDFDPERPDTTGWVFQGGLLTAREIERVARPPRLIVANACLSGQVSRRGRGAAGASTTSTRVEGALVPSLADEFLKIGVMDYVGTAWEVDDAGAVEFATRFYAALLDGRGDSIGDALRTAREALFEKAERYDALWAAYQHYGDPGRRLG
jgi:hypothetical protein